MFSMLRNAAQWFWACQNSTAAQHPTKGELLPSARIRQSGLWLLAGYARLRQGLPELQHASIVYIVYVLPLSRLSRQLGVQRRS